MHKTYEGGLLQCRQAAKTTTGQENTASHKTTMSLNFGCTREMSTRQVRHCVAAERKNARTQSAQQKYRLAECNGAEHADSSHSQEIAVVAVAADAAARAGHRDASDCFLAHSNH